MKEDWLENLAAANTAHGFVLEILLSRYFKTFPAGPLRDDIASTMLATGQQTAQFHGAVPEFADAVQFADVVVKSHAQLSDLIARAMERAAASDTA